MEYVVVFLAGALAGVVAMFQYIAAVRATQKRVTEWDARLQKQASEVAEKEKKLTEAAAEFETRKIKYDALVQENGGLKQDCFNLSVQTKKMERRPRRDRTTAK